MKKFILCGLVVLSAGCVFSQATEPVEYEDFAVFSATTGQSIHITDSVTEVEKVLGQPEEEKIKEFDFGNYVEYIYNGLIVGHFSGDENLYTIGIQGSEFITARGLTVGSRYSDFVEKYGQPTRVYQSNGSYELVLYELVNPRAQQGVNSRNVLVLNLNFKNGDEVSGIFLTFRS